jgi:hypothetical protein
MSSKATLILLAAAVLMAAGSLAAQADPSRIPPPPPPPPSDTPLVTQLEMEFSGFDARGLAEYRVLVGLRPAIRDDGRVLAVQVRLRDTVPPAIDVVCESCARTVEADPSYPSEHSFVLTADWYFRGPLVLEVWEPETGMIHRSFGPLQLPRPDAGITPYGTLGRGANQLPLFAYRDGADPCTLLFEVRNLQPGVPAVLGISPLRTESPLLGGTLLIGPDPIIPFHVQADSNGVASVEMTLDPVEEGQLMFVQAAAARIEPNGDETVLFTNGVEIVMRRSSDG